MGSFQQWGIAVGIAAAVLIGLRWMVPWLARRLDRLAERSNTSIDNAVIHGLSSLLSPTTFIIAIWAGSKVLDLPERAATIINGAAIVAAFFQVGWSLSAIIQELVTAKKHDDAISAEHATTMSAVGFVGRIAVWAVVLLLALDNLGIDVTALVAGLGVGGIAVALALQNLLGDLFASLSIVLDKPFVIGDFLDIGGDKFGTVEKIGLKTTRLRSLSGEQLVVSNSDLLSSRIRNYKRMAERRCVFAFGVTYDTPARVLAEIPKQVRRIIDETDNARYDRAHFKSFGASSLDFEVVYYTTMSDYVAYMDAQQAINLQLVSYFEQEGIEFAFPTRTVWLHQADAASAQAAPEQDAEGEEREAA